MTYRLSKMSRFKPALQPEILRAHQKDEQHITSLQRDVSEIARAGLGTRQWMQWRSEIDSLASLMYYCATTLIGSQTLGEEYVHILQLSRSLTSVPSIAQRLALVVAQSFGGNIVKGAVNLLKRERGVDTAAVNAVLENALKVHTILFYLVGGYHSPAKRLTGIRYVLIRNWLFAPDVARYYKVLGWLSLAEFVVSLRSAVKLFRASPESCYDGENRSSRYECSMCVDCARDASAIPCGHVFCWLCIAGWLRTNRQCPLCRVPCEPQQIVLLLNV